MNPYSLAVCEDDRTIRETVCRFCDEILEEAGIPHEVTAFSRVEEAEAALAAKKQIHLLILADPGYRNRRKDRRGTGAGTARQG